MLTKIAEGVFVHPSDCMQTNGVIVQGEAGVLLVDPGLTETELACLLSDLDELGQPVVAGFSTHPHWDHVLWHPGFGDVPRYATASGAAAMDALLAQEEWAARVAGVLPAQIAGAVPMDLFGELTGLAGGATRVPWAGPEARVIEHRAHTTGHAALLIGERRVLVAGDMLSDVLMPFLDLTAADPVGDHLDALNLLEEVADQVKVVVPGHGSVGGADDLRERIDMDRAYVLAVRNGTEVDDPRIDSRAKHGWEWVSGVHAWQVQQLAK